MSCSDSEKLKIQKKFSKKLILEAYNANYEPQEIASLVDIVLSLLNLESDEVLSFVVKCGICDPLVLGSIKNAEFSSSQIIDIMLAQGKDQFLINIEEAFEQHLLSLKDQDTREYLHERISDWADEEVLRCVVKLCQHASSKRVCGQLLANFTMNMSSQEAVGFVDDVLSHDFFLDLRGSLKDTLKCLPDIQSELTQLFEHRQSLSNGELVDSDEDEDGNLRDFVVDDDYESYDSSEETSPSEASDGKKRPMDEGARLPIDLTSDSPAVERKGPKARKITVLDDSDDE